MTGESVQPVPHYWSTQAYKMSFGGFTLAALDSTLEALTAGRTSVGTPVVASPAPAPAAGGAARGGRAGGKGRGGKAPAGARKAKPVVVSNISHHIFEECVNVAQRVPPHRVCTTFVGVACLSKVCGYSALGLRGF